MRAFILAALAAVADAQCDQYTSFRLYFDPVSSVKPGLTGFGASAHICTGWFSVDLDGTALAEEPIVDSNSHNGAARGDSSSMWHVYDNQLGGVEVGLEGSRAAGNNYCSGSIANWPTTGDKPWISITYPAPVNINSYSVGSLNGYQTRWNPDIYHPLSWEFQASTDGTTWITLDAQEGPSTSNDEACRLCPPLEQCNRELPPPCTDAQVFIVPFPVCAAEPCTAVDTPDADCAPQDCTAVDTPYAGCTVPTCTDVDTPYAGCTVPTCTAVDTPYAGCTIPACSAVDTPYAGCTVPDCTADDTPYVGCTVPACTAVETPYAGCVVQDCTAVDTPYAGCTALDCTAADTPYAGCTALDCTAADTPYAGCTALDCTDDTDTPYTGCTVAPCTDADTPYAGCATADCAGSWSACTTACEAAADRTWTETTAAVGTGAACPDAAACAPGDDACPAPTPPPAPTDASAAGMTTVTLAAAAIAAAIALY